MSDTHGAAAPAENEYGLSPEEQAAFADMRSQPAPQGDAGYTPEPTPADNTPPASTGAAPAAGAAPQDPPKPAASAGTAPAPAAGAAAPPAAGGPAGGAVDADDDDESDTGLNADGTPKPPPKRVSYNKFKRLEDEKTKTAAELKAAQEANAKLTETQARLDERLKLINEALTTTPAQQATQDDDPEPDKEKDIFAHNDWLARQLAKTQTQIKELTGNLQETARVSQADQELASSYVADAQRLASTDPNFLPAYNYLMQVRIAQLANYHFGIDMTDENAPELTAKQVSMIKSEIAREEKQLVSKAIASGKSPAGAVYAMAKMTGFRPAAPGAAPAAGAAPAPNGAAPPTGAASTAAAAVAAAPAAGKPAAPVNGGAAPGAAPTVADEIRKIQQGQDAVLSLSAGGGAPAPTLDARKLADMPEEEFGKLLDQMSRGDLRRIMGGA